MPPTGCRPPAGPLATRVAGGRSGWSSPATGCAQSWARRNAPPAIGGPSEKASLGRRPPTHSTAPGSGTLGWSSLVLNIYNQRSVFWKGIGILISGAYSSFLGDLITGVSSAKMFKAEFIFFSSKMLFSRSISRLPSIEALFCFWASMWTMPPSECTICTLILPL